MDCRSPCGERGLKWQGLGSAARCIGRSPCGERGLKSADCRACLIATASLPVRGAWVEIMFCGVKFSAQCGRSPCGERGLKCCTAASSLHR